MRQKTVAFIKARWHAEIVDKAYEGFLQSFCYDDGLQALPFDVPGAFEMPLLAQRLGKSGRFDAIVAAALVVDGGIYRHDFVAHTVVSGLMSVQLEIGVPVFSVSLTPHHFHSTPEHIEFFKKHFYLKGEEAAHAVRNILTLQIPPIEAHTKTTG